MPLLLRIENMDTLPDGGPVSMEIDRRGIDIGRDTFLDWTLPDPERFISGKHLEIHFRDGGYWAHDVSTNGTTVNGGSGRLTEPCQLKDGDRLHIGMYIVAVSITGPEAQPAAPAAGAAPAGGGDLWGVSDAAEAVDRRQFTAQSAPQKPSAVPFGSDLAEEHIGWSVGDAGGPASADPAELDWGTPAGGTGGDASADWAAAPPAAEKPAPAGDTPDWAAAPPSGLPNPAPVAAPEPAPAPEPEPQPPAQPAAEPAAADDDAPAPDWRAAPAGAASEMAEAQPNPAAVPTSEPAPQNPAAVPAAEPATPEPAPEPEEEP
ncbi:MAG: FHA domain-containing protein, partial [Pseudomonadota bacterium]